MKKKSLVSILLTLVMLVALLPISKQNVFAYGNSGNIVSGADRASFAVMANGDLYGWDDLCGFETDEDITKPVKIMSDVVSVCGGSYFAMALKKDGSLWAWGSNDSGVLGDGTTESKGKPVKVMDNVVSFSCGWRHAAAVKANGELWTWGNNTLGMLGNGKQTINENGDWGKVITNNDALKPIKIMDGVASVSCGFYHTAAVKTNGELWTWGLNNSGQLGNGTRTNSLTPIKVMDGVASAAAGRSQTLAVKTNGELWALNEGQMFNDSGFPPNFEDNINCITPCMVTDNVAFAAAGQSTAYALKVNGELWKWDCNSFGSPNYEVKLSKEMDDVAKVGTGGLHTVALKTNGEVWFMGSDYYRRGELVKIMNINQAPATTPTAPVTPVTPPAAAATETAKSTSSTVLVNGENVAFDAYVINGNNYFKLRDLAYVLNGTQKQFAVSWDGAKNAINLLRGEGYTADGSEMKGKGAGEKTATLSTSTIYIDGTEVKLTAYTIDGNNYFKLRDIGAAFDFSMTWDGAKNTIAIDTGLGYTPE